MEMETVPLLVTENFGVVENTSLERITRSFELESSFL